MNFYRINEAFHFVDLPGYGYAAAPEHVRRSFGPMVEGFLGRWGEQIALAILLVDARIGPTELDRTMDEWLRATRTPSLVAATKADKLSGSGRQARLEALCGGLGDDPATRAEGGPLLVSARTGLGIRELWKHLDRALAARNTEKEKKKGKDRWTSVS